MSISKTKNYMVLNYSASPVGISTRYDSFLVPGGSLESPGSLPLTFDEIAVVNSKSPVFKIGLLCFEPEYEAELYEALSIPSWKEILTEEQIQDALTNPTMESSQKILDIENDAYFERVRGVMIGLRNAGVDIPGKIERMIEQRRLELVHRQRKTEIKLVPNEPEKPAPSQEEFDAMKAQLSAMQEMMAKLIGNDDVNESAMKSNQEAKQEPSAKPTAKKPRTNTK